MGMERLNSGSGFYGKKMPQLSKPHRGLHISLGYHLTHPASVVGCHCPFPCLAFISSLPGYLEAFAGRTWSRLKALAMLWLLLAVSLPISLAGMLLALFDHHFWRQDRTSRAKPHGSLGTALVSGELS